MKKLAKIVFIAIIVCGALAFLLIKPIDCSDYKSQMYYKRTIDSLNLIIERQSFESLKTPVLSGWAQQNITPPFTAPMVGYSIRDDFAGVLDSLFVSAFVFRDHKQTIAYLSFDLLIITNTLTDAIDELLIERNICLSGIYYTATHTHNSYGGYAEGLASAFILGGYDKQSVDFLAARTVEAIENAIEKVQSTTFNYIEIETCGLIKNKFDSTAFTDNNLRLLEMTNESGNKSVLTVFSAHTTTLSSRLNLLTGDFTSILNTKLRNNFGYDFAAYSAGAVGGYAPLVVENIPDDGDPMKRYTYAYAQSYADSLFEYVQNNKDTVFEDFSSLSFFEVPVFLPNPQFRIGSRMQLRPWVFNAVFGEIRASIKIFRIDDVAFVGLPCDFAGELTPPLKKLADKKNISLVITSFNGNYIGYISPSKYFYTSTRAEINEMNWFGSNSGDYFVEIISEIIQKM
ncbi:MAG: neutral/alkaline non-lysosomal ceramidase N-terminal domain-containing protein [Paludibacteraceae bacterium]|nr:neutral/alkaline non-lysosomal ceramidase N-terminal domain-containing protein [Paludibacteraceae bacterium]